MAGFFVARRIGWMFGILHVMLVLLDIESMWFYIAIHLKGGIVMPYREKIAWLSLIAMGVTFVPYFAIVASGRFADNPLPNLPLMACFAATTITQMIILGVGHLYLRSASPEDARTPPDERDRAITQRAMTTAYYALMAGVILVGCIMPFKQVGWSIVNAAILSIVLAEIIHYSVVVVSYRRQV